MNAKKRPISAREATAYIPPLNQFAGCYTLKTKLLDWTKRPVEEDANLLVEGDPGTGKTTIIIAYLREQFKNPWFFYEQFDPQRQAEKATGVKVPDPDTKREWQTGSKGMIFFTQINGSLDSEAALRSKTEELRYRVDADHRIGFLDELGEAFFRGFDEMFRPLRQDPGIALYATAQNFHSRRKTDTSKEEDQRLAALLRGFPHREKTERPTEPDHLTYVIFLIKEWVLKVDHPSTLRLLVEKSRGLVSYSHRTLVKAIDAPDRRLTRQIVEKSDVDLLC